MLRDKQLQSNLINAAIFQLVWIACVAGGAAGLWWVGLVAVFAFAIWQVPRSRHPRGEVALLLAAAVIGLAVDTALLRFGMLEYPSHGPFAFMAPLWIVALWAGFALTLNHSLAWLHGRPVIAAVLGGISGPFSYWIGARAWGAVDFAASPQKVAGALALAWAIALPLLMEFARRLDGPSFGPLVLRSSPVLANAPVTNRRTQKEWRSL